MNLWLILLSKAVLVWETQAAAFVRMQHALVMLPQLENAAIIVTALVYGAVLSCRNLPRDVQLIGCAIQCELVEHADHRRRPVRFWLRWPV